MCSLTEFLVASTSGFISRRYYPRVFFAFLRGPCWTLGILCGGRGVYPFELWRTGVGYLPVDGGVRLGGTLRERIGFFLGAIPVIEFISDCLNNL